ncbi:hypothetical protein B296_00037508 [Ensete ventricosum]|uniref:RING-type domain-containing protein n=1 Tax=Ensete ventricosum TaxID=4639 RepID=A0A426XFU1_ENSVE|nr:hypothetical protein B296_00037508 [Ensete ventricosum]
MELCCAGDGGVAAYRLDRDVRRAAYGGSIRCKSGELPPPSWAPQPAGLDVRSTWCHLRCGSRAGGRRNPLIASVLLALANYRNPVKKHREDVHGKSRTPMCYDEEGLGAVRARDFVVGSSFLGLNVGLAPGKTCLPSAGATGGAAASDLYFCFQCDRAFTLGPANAGDHGVIFCIHCGGSVAQGSNFPNFDNPNSDLGSVDAQQPAPSHLSDHDADSVPFDHLIMLPFASSVADFYFDVMLMEQHLEQWSGLSLILAPSRRGTHPAWKAAVEALPDINIKETAPGTDPIQCTICMEPFDAGAVVKQLPCKHMFHKKCPDYSDSSGKLCFFRKYDLISGFNGSIYV